MKLKLNNFFIIVIFFIISLVLLKNIIFHSGIIFGNDWSMPFTKLQIDNYFEKILYTWHEINFGVRNIGLNSLIFTFFFYALSLIGLNGAIISKIILLFLFTFSSYSFFSLLRYLKCNIISSFLGGLIYITTPIFFDYTIIGWGYVILFMGLLPIGLKYFLKANLENKISYSLITAIIYSIALAQSQALLWFIMIFLIFGFYLIKNKQTFLIYIKNLSLIFSVTFLLSFFWLGGLLIAKESAISGSDIVSSAASLGTVGNFKPINIIRLFGGLFNFQYEFIINTSRVVFLSFLIPLLVFLSLFIKKIDKKIVIIFFIIGLIPLGMYVLNFYRDVLIYIPFSNVIRDFARFTVFSTFSFSVLATLFLNYLLADKKILKKIFFVFLVILWVISIFPWWSGYISKWEKDLVPHQRLRLKNIDQEYNELDYFLSDIKSDYKALFLPINGTISFEDDEKFKGAYQEAQDIFASYSPLGGLIVINDRNVGYGDLLNKKIIKNVLENDFEKIDNLSSILNQNYYIIRKNMVLSNKEAIIKFLDNNKNLIKIIDNNKISVYKMRENILPHFYTPQTVISTNQGLEILPEIVSENDYNIRTAIYFDNIYKESTDSKEEVKFNPNELEKETVNNTPVIEFKKINSTKYRVIIHNATENFPLVFSESFHEGWKAYLAKLSNFQSNSNDKIFNNQIEERMKDYKILDGNKNDQASRNEVEKFIGQGLISDLGNGRNKEIKHQKWENDQEKLDYTERYSIDFISKNFQDTIQNNNLANGPFYETWFKQPIDNNANHLVANGYANSWLLDPDRVCTQINKCQKNLDGSYDFELIVEFWPQRLFYLGLFISGIILFGCIWYLVYDWKKIKINHYYNNIDHLPNIHNSWIEWQK